MSKTGRKNKRYTPEFKIRVIMDMREHPMGVFTGNRILARTTRSVRFGFDGPPDRHSLPNPFDSLHYHKKCESTRWVLSHFWWI